MTATVAEKAIARFVPVTGTLVSEEQADVAAEVSGRVVATPVERGTQVNAGSDLIRIADSEVRAQADEAAANAAQIEARLGIADGARFTVEAVPEVANARAAHELAQSEFERARNLLERKILSQADFDRSRAQAAAAQRQYEISRNSAEQQYQSLLAARARLALARKAVADTAVRAPFAGTVEQRFVSVGDYVVKGTKVASVLRTSPLRVELTVPAQYISTVAPGRSVALNVDAYPGRQFTGRVRYVSPSLNTDSRTLLVEAVVPNETGELKPGLFATARVEQASPKPALLVPAASVRMVAGTAHLFVLNGDRVEERIVTTGQASGDDIEIVDGVKAGDIVAASNVNQLVDGVAVAVAR